MRETQNISGRDSFLQDFWLTETPLMKKAKEAAANFGKAFMSISAYEGALLKWFVSRESCKTCVEIGTFTGYSSLWLASGLASPGHLWTLDSNLDHAKEAQKIFSLWEGPVHIESLVGEALVLLKELESQGPFDCVFIDANKSGYPLYLDWAERNVKKGGLILADNVFLGGSFWDPSIETYGPNQIQKMKEFLKRLFVSDHYQTMILPTQEGLSVSLKL